MVVNIKTIKVSLSEQGLDNLITKLNTLKEGLKDADEKIVKDMATFVESQVSNNLASTPYKDGNEDASAYSDIKGNKAEAGMQGSQVVYDEFGTGTQGANAPHPDKSKFALKGYNTGPKIKVSKTGELFWLYKDKNGELVKTQGIPAGKQVFNASVLLKGKKIQIIKKRVGEVISKL